MAHRYSEIAFTPAVEAIQRESGSARQYTRMREFGSENAALGPFEAEFIGNRDGFYLATVSETGWPYIQHRGGPKGFLRVIDERTIGFLDFRGNRQYITAGNAQGNDRVSLFLMDYANQARLKIFGRLKIADAAQHPELRVANYNGVPERAMMIQVEAFDWNCQQHIVPRWTEEELAARPV
jgi:uncharacterized protein